jgi:ubiquinone/menaquinone biosynthesis C-methylase UbiE
MENPQKRDQLNYYENQVKDYEKQNSLLTRGLNRTYERKADIIIKTLKKINASKILEIGAGSGLMTYFLSNKFEGEIVALDLSKEMLELAKKRINNNNVTYVVGDGVNPDFPLEYFDAIIGVDIIHHLDDPRQAMKNWKKLVKTDGKMVFLETNVYNPINLRNIGVEHEVRSFLNTDKNLKIWAKDAGWEIVDVTPSESYTPAGPFFMVPIYKLIDKISPKIPFWKKLTALWLINATKKQTNTNL